MAQDGIAPHGFGIWVQLDHDSQILQRVLLQDSTAYLFPGKEETCVTYCLYRDHRNPVPTQHPNTEISDLTTKPRTWRFLKKPRFPFVRGVLLLGSAQCLLDFLASHDSSNVRIGHLVHGQAAKQTVTVISWMIKRWRINKNRHSGRSASHQLPRKNQHHWGLVAPSLFCPAPRGPGRWGLRLLVVALQRSSFAPGAVQIIQLAEGAFSPNAETPNVAPGSESQQVQLVHIEESDSCGEMGKPVTSVCARLRNKQTKSSTSPNQILRTNTSATWASQNFHTIMCFRNTDQ